MLAHRIALAAAIAVLAAPATAFATNADGATPTATPLIAELAVAALVIGALGARRRVAALARSAVSRLARLRPHRHNARVSER
jgi:hypothetical protein